MSEDLLKYLESLQKVGRAKSCRFLGIDAEASSRCGEGISWLLLAKSILTGSAATASGSSSSTSIDKLRRELSERKEAKHIAAADPNWGMDAGRAEEIKVLEALEGKWRKLNDSIMFQTLPDVGELMKRIPSGREFHSLKAWEAPMLGAEEMRALKAEEAGGLEYYAEEADSEEEEERSEEVAYAGKGGYY